MSRNLGRGIAVTLLLASACGSTKPGAIDPGGGTAGSGGSAGGVSGNAGGEPANGGATGAAGTGTAGTSSGGAGDAGATGAARDGGGDAGSGWLTPPPVPPALEPPAGATVKLHAHAVGAQIYTCAASGGADAGADAGATTYAWALKAPDAKLYDSSGAQIGTHFAGPSWMDVDGSVARGAKVVELPAPTADAITWLLLRASSTTGPGVLTDVTYVQRLNTVGGRAPATGCDTTTVGAETRAGYSADYYFYAGGGASAAWLTAPTVPDAIALPQGMKLKLHAHALGAQIYGCLANGGADAGADGGATTYAWVFKAPEAILYDEQFVPVASHGAGPTWTWTDGSVLEARELARAAAPRADAIPWLLLKELSTSGQGVLSDVAIVQRVNTAGGQAPTAGCDATTAGTQIRSPYSADDYFFVSADTPIDGGGSGS